MSWTSLLPEQFSFVEVWIVRVFLFLGLITIGPWAGLIVYDFLLYCFRSAFYEIPVFGGRARGRQRPRAPSLSYRPGGHARRFSLGVSPSLPTAIYEDGEEPSLATARDVQRADKRHDRS